MAYIAWTIKYFILREGGSASLLGVKDWINMQPLDRNRFCKWRIL